MQENVRFIPSMEQIDQDSNGNQGGQADGIKWVKMKGEE
jgi:hypothetical protein